jgi:antitoxin StbD
MRDGGPTRACAEPVWRFGTYSSTVSRVTEVLPTNEARARLNQIAAGFDHDGPDAAPVVFGSHRRAQGVIVSWQLWQRIAPAVEDALDADLVRRRLGEPGDRLSHEQLLAMLDRNG